MRRPLFAVIALLLATVMPADAQNCKKGKPCGNTCIARSKTCHVGQGTARWAPGVSDTASVTKAAAADIMANAGAMMPCTVSSVTDGDTLRCREYKQAVRLLLIDAPEMTQGTAGAEARDALLKLTPIGASVMLEFDVQTMDRYNRALAYVRTGGLTIINVEMARSGHALALTYPPNVKYVDQVRAAVEEAKAAKRGLWGGSAFECSPKDHRDKKC